MKKLSLLIALCMLISIGGVYAIWTYGGAAPEANHKHMSINLQTVTNSAAEGVIRQIANTMDVEICNDDDRDYLAELKFNGYMAFYFDPHSGATDEVQRDGIPLQWIVEQTNPGLAYDNTPVFTINMADPQQLTPQEVTEENKNTLCPGTDLSAYVDKKIFIVNAEMVAAKVSTSLTLPTYPDYVAFDKILDETAAKIGITISKYVAPVVQ